MAEYVTDADMAPPLMSPEGKSEGVGELVEVGVGVSGSQRKS